MIVRSGIPAVLAAGEAEMGQAVADITPGSISMSNVISNVLAQFADAAVIVIDPHTGKVYASSEAAAIEDLGDAVEGDETVYAPDVDQTGRSLKWAKVSGAGITDDEPLYTAVKPSFTVESLVSRLLAILAEMEAFTPALASKQFLVINQVNKTVRYVNAAAPVDARTNLEAVVLNTAGHESVKVQLTPEAGESSPAALPFEGGAV
jgi:hypothetical protein